MADSGHEAKQGDGALAGSVRRSERLNKGQPPSRFGDAVDWNKEKEKRATAGPRGTATLPSTSQANMADDQRMDKEQSFLSRSFEERRSPVRTFSVTSSSTQNIQKQILMAKLESAKKLQAIREQEALAKLKAEQVSIEAQKSVLALEEELKLAQIAETAELEQILSDDQASGSGKDSQKSVRRSTRGSRKSRSKLPFVETFIHDDNKGYRSMAEHKEDLDEEYDDDYCATKSFEDSKRVQGVDPMGVTITSFRDSVEYRDPPGVQGWESKRPALGLGAPSAMMSQVTDGYLPWSWDRSRLQDNPFMTVAGAQFTSQQQPSQMDLQAGSTNELLKFEEVKTPAKMAGVTFVGPFVGTNPALPANRADRHGRNEKPAEQSAGSHSDWFEQLLKKREDLNPKTPTLLHRKSESVSKATRDQEGKVGFTLNNPKPVPKFQSHLSVEDPPLAANCDASVMRDMTTSFGHIKDMMMFLASNQQAAQPKVKSDGAELFMTRQSMLRDLPLFSGEPEEWANFYATFMRTTQICKFSADENLARLQRCLREAAKDAVSALMSTPFNVPEIMSTLEEQFGKPRIIIGRLIEKTKALPPVKEEKMEAWTEFSTKVRTLVTSMQNLNCKSHLCNPALLDELISKLPLSHRVKWGEYLEDLSEEPDLEKFSVWVTKRVKMLRNITVYPKATDVSQKSKDQPKQAKEPTKPKKKEAETLLMVKEQTCSTEEQTSAEKSNPSKKECAYCKQEGHWALKCPKFHGDAIEDRWKIVRSCKLCLGCLSPKHSWKECKTKRQCTAEGCNYSHHPKLHKDKACTENSAGTSPNSAFKNEESVSNISEGIKHKVLLRIIEILIKGKNGTKRIFALFDEGASCTLLDKSVASELGLIGSADPLQVNMAFGPSQQYRASERVDFGVADLLGSEFFPVQRARTVTGLNVAAQSVNVPQMRKTWKYLLDKGIPSYQNVRPKMIIGQDNYHLIVPRELIEGPPNAPVMTRTKLGWMIHGNAMPFKNGVNKEFISYYSVDLRDDELHQLIESYFSIDSLGIHATAERESEENKRAFRIMTESTSKLDGRFQTGLLWAKDDIKLPESRTAAEKRLKSLENRMTKDPVFAEEYCAKMDHFMEQGYARPVNPGELATAGERKWYIPHFGVRNPRKPKKLRLVFDCAAKSNGLSLNEALLTGPDYLTSLPKSLFNFRRGRIALTGDIREMYPQIKIIGGDQPSQLFLWRGLRKDVEPQEYVMTSMMFGTRSSPSSAQFVKNLNADQHKIQYPEAARAIKENHYMDNYLDSFDTVEEAKKLFDDVLFVHSQAGFKMVDWSSNSKKVLQMIPTELISTASKDWSIDLELPIERILGMKWDPNTDRFTFDLNFYKVNPKLLTLEEIPTKRDVAKIVMAIFDPLGLVSNLTVAGKILQQDVWRSKIDWDEELPENILSDWGEYIHGLEKVKAISIPRCYILGKGRLVDRQLHLFSDASTQAFATAAYLRTVFQDRVEVVLVMAKNRVVPLKPTTLTIPRLELQAAVLSARLAKCVQEGHEQLISSTTFWTDSQVVLKWIRSDATKFQVFVSNRLGQIDELSKVEQWRFVPTKHNPADIATRLRSDVDSKFWFEGPDFFRSPESDWPTEVSAEISVAQLELKKCESLNYFTDNDNFFGRFSSYYKMLKVAAIALRVLTWGKAVPTKKGIITAKEIQRAKIRLERKAQTESFPQYMNEDHCAPKENPRLIRLFPFKDQDGILRVRGRIGKSKTASLANKHPIILDPGHRYTQLLISSFHEKAMHQGQETVLNNLRQNYWVINGRQAVKRAFRNCQKCKNAKANPIPPIMAALPSFRVTKQSRPWSVTRIDYFGPMEVTIGRRHEKRWGVLFTCLTTRAVHIELAASLSADSCIQAIRRFVSRREVPDRIISDNGTNFRGASAELQQALEELNQDKIAVACVHKGIDWSFIPPHAPHMGGCWERLIGSIKTALKAVLRERSPKEETLV